MTDKEKIDCLQKQLDLTNKNYNILNEKYEELKKAEANRQKLCRGAMGKQFSVEYPYGNNLGHTLEWYPGTKAGQKKAIQDLKYYKAKLTKMVEDRDEYIKKLETVFDELEEDYIIAIDIMAHK